MELEDKNDFPVYGVAAENNGRRITDGKSRAYGMTDIENLRLNLL